jgi:predicted dehydrogenase
MTPIRVGLIGASIDRGWAASAHIPALKALPEFELAAVATTRQESADAIAQRYGIPRAFGDWQEMVQRPDIDLVIVTVKVASHRDPVLGALAAGKHVFCEWPLALDSASAGEMLDAARRAGVQHMVGLQGRVHPVLNHVRARGLAPAGSRGSSGAQLAPLKPSSRTQRSSSSAAAGPSCSARWAKPL